jgi:[ribosomal protein S18]-alanine N-acetyltransferase
VSPPEQVSAATVHLRPLEARDLPAVLDIERAAFAVPWRERTFRSLFLRDDVDLVAAERDGGLVGYAICWSVADQAELGNIAVAAEARGSGVGRALLDAALAAVRLRGVQECFLEVRESNHGAQRLYRRAGFEVVGRRPRYYTRPLEDALVMRADLQVMA